MHATHSNLHGSTMEWSDVRIFLAVARSGSLGAAGRALALAQPTVGRRISSLEQTLGQTLFQRTHTGLTLTDEGHAVLPVAERMEEEALAFERRLTGSDARLRGALRITASDWFGSHVLAPALAGFCRQHPDVEIELLTDARLYDLARREADIAFRITPFESPDVVSRRFADIEYGVFVSRDHAQRLQSDVRLITMSAAYAAMPDVAWLHRQFPQARAVYRSNSREVQARACAAGAGMAMLPLRLAASFPELVRIPLDEPPPSRSTWVGYHRDLRRLERLRAVLAHLERNS